MTAPVVLITGAAIGIGRATALAFGKAGYHVIVTDILETEGRATVKDIGANAEFHRLDVRSTAEADAVIAAVEQAHGALDCIVANAGIARRAPLADLSDEKWDATFDIDLKGMFRAIRPALPAMRRARRGSIICLSSIMGSAYGWDEHVHYSAAKTGVIGLMRGLAVELARDGIRCNAIAPGYIRTAQLLSKEHSVGPDADKCGAYIPMGRIGEPEDIADVILFLSSNAARYITGQVVVVDGGLQAGRY